MLLFRSNGLGVTRIAFVTGSRIGGAVARNRSRRLLREAFRRLRPHVDLHGLDVALIARPRSATVRAQAVAEELAGLYRTAGLWRDLWPPHRSSGPA